MPDLLAKVILINIILVLCSANIRTCYVHSHVINIVVVIFLILQI